MRRCCHLAAVILAGYFLFVYDLSAQSVQKGKKDATTDNAADPNSSTGNETPKPAAKSLDELPLPQDAIVIICEKINEAQKWIPKGFLVSPKKYQEFSQLKEQIKLLQKQLNPTKIKPNSCKMTGKFSSNAVDLVAVYQLVTHEPNTVVELGCQGAFLMKVEKIDDFPFLRYTPSGYEVKIPQPGRQQLTLHFRVPVKTRLEEVTGGSFKRTFTLPLPGAAVTFPFTLELPKHVQEVTWNEFSETKRIQQGNSTLWKIPLTGDMNRLSLSWREPGSQLGNQSQVSADWDIAVNILNDQIHTTAKVVIDDPGGNDPGKKSVDWRILAPAGCKVQIKSREPIYQQSIEKTFAQTAIYRIQGPPTQQLELSFSDVRSRTKGKNSVGPYLISGVASQPARIVVQSAPEVLRGFGLTYHKTVDLRRSPSLPFNGNPETIDIFSCWNLAQGLRPGILKSIKALEKVGPTIEIELIPLNSQVETAVNHSLLIQRGETSWTLVTKSEIQCTPLFGVDFLDVVLPSQSLPALVVPGNSASPDILPGLLTMSLCNTIEPIEPEGSFSFQGKGPAFDGHLLPLVKKNIVRVSLAKKLSEPFTITLIQKYRVSPLLEEIQAPLPKPITLSDKGAKITVRLEDQQMELAPQASQPAVLSKQRDEQVTLLPYAPASFSIGMKPFQPEIPVQVVADVQLHRHELRIREQLVFDFSRLRKQSDLEGKLEDVRLVKLKLPDGLNNLQLLAGGVLHEHDRTNATASIQVVPGKPLELQYDLAVRSPKKSDVGEPEINKSLETQVPLIVPVDYTHLDTKVRFWSDPGVVPIMPGGTPGNDDWEDTGVEVVSGKDRLPSLVVETRRTEPQLTVLWDISSSVIQSDMVADRALIQVLVKEDGEQQLRCRYRLSWIAADFQIIDFPVSFSKNTFPVVRLDGKSVPVELMPNRKSVKMQLNPSLYNSPVILDIVFSIPPDGRSLVTSWQALLGPPKFRGSFQLHEVRWQLHVSAAIIPLVIGPEYHSPYRWHWQGWLFSPESEYTDADLEYWLTKESVDPEESESADVVFWNKAGAGSFVVFVPRLVWILICSGVLLAVGVGVSYLPLRRIGSWCVLFLLGVAVLLVGLFLPALLPLIVYGIQPGVAVLAVILITQWLLHRRYRRQIIFMPGFTRMRQGSSISKPKTNVKKEPSTVDAGPNPESSLTGLAAENQ